MDSLSSPGCCPNCGQDAFDCTDISYGTRLVCTECGYVLDEVELVNQAVRDEEGQQINVGTYVAADDDGQRAGAAMMHGDGEAHGVQSASNRHPTHRILQSNRDRMEPALNDLGLPQHVAATAKQLLPLVVDANANAIPRRNTTAATVAAVVYMAAREEQYALSLGRVGAAFQIYGVEVGREFRQLSLLLQRPAPPPLLSTLVVGAAAQVLPHYIPDMTGPLRQQPVVRKALDVARLLQKMEAVDGYSPAVGAAAILCMCLSEQYKDAKPSAYAGQVAAMLQHDTNAVRQHIRRYTHQLSSLLKLLPFATGGSGTAALEGVRHAGVLIQLLDLSARAQPQQQQQSDKPCQTLQQPGQMHAADGL